MPLKRRSSQTLHDPVCNAVLMTVVNCAHHLSEDVLGLVLLQTAHFLHVAPQISMNSVLHHHIGVLFGTDDVEQLDDVCLV